MADLSITGEVVVTSEKAEGAFDRVGAKAGQMASKVQAEATKAGAAVDNIGTGAEAGAEKFTRAESRMRSAIQKSTRELEMLGKTASQKFEAQLEFKGLDKAKFQPFLNELRKTEEAAAKARDGVSGIGDAARVAGSMMAAAFSGAALLGVVGKVVSVQREFDVLNSSLKTVTGSSAAAEREMSWLKDFAKETPFGLAQATQGFVKMKALGLDPTRAALTSFGNTASAMGKDLNQMIEAVADASTGEFERLKEFGIKAKKEGDNVSLTFQGVTTTIQNSAADITKYLENIGNTSFGGAMEERAKTLDGTIAALGDTWDELFRTVSTNNVGSLIFDSVTLANGALEDATTILRAMGGAAQDASRDTGALSTIQNGIATVFETVAVLGANLKYVLVQIGNEIGGLAAQVAQAARFNFSGVAAIRSQMVADAEAARREIDATTERILRARKAQEEYARWATRNASAATDPRRVDLGGGTTRATGGASSGAAKAVKETISEYDKLIKKLSDELPRAAAEAEAAQMGYNKAQTEFLALAASPAWAKFTNDQRATVAALFENKIASEQSAVAAKTLAKANLDAAASREKYLTSLSTGLDKIQADITAQIEATERMGLSKEAIAALDAAKLEMLATDLELQAVKALDRNLDQQTYDALKKQAQAYRELGAAKKGGAAKEAALEMEKANAEAAKKAQEDWERAAEQINGSLTDALLRGFESGKGFAKNFVDTMKNLFSTLVLRPIISAVVNPVAGAITGALGLAGTANAGTSALAGGGGSAGGLLNLGSSLFGAGGMTGSLMAGAGWLTGATTFGGALGAAGSLIGTGTAAGIGSGLAMGAGALAPILAPLALLAMSGAFSRKHEQHNLQGTFGGATGFEGNWHDYYKGGLFRSSKTVDTPLEAGFLKGLQDAWNAQEAAVTSYAQALGLATDSIAGFTYDVNIKLKDLDPKAGDYQQQLMARVADAIKAGSNEMAQQIIGSWDTVQETVTRHVQQFGDDGGFSTVEETITRQTYVASEFAREGESAIDTLTRLGSSLQAVNSVFDTLGYTLLSASLASGDLASSIIDAFGGQERFGAQTGSYFQNYYSAAERRATLQRQLTDEMDRLGFVLPATRDGFRRLVEAQRLTTTEGQQTYAALIGLSGAFAEITQSSEEAAQALSDDTDRAFAALSRYIDQQRELWQTALQAAQTLVAEARDIRDTASGAARELWGQSDDTRAMLAVQGRATIDRMLSGLRATGALPDADELSRAIEDARGGLDMSQYATVAEYELAQALLAGQLSEIGDLAGEQMTVAEKQVAAAEAQIKQLDQTLDFWREQIDLMRDTFDVITNLDAGIAVLADAVRAEQAAKEEAAKEEARRAASTHTSPGGGGWGDWGGGGGQDLRSITRTINWDTGEYVYPDGSGGTLSPEELEYFRRIMYGEISPTRVIDDLYQVPRHADGGRYAGGLALVGERGPELINFASPGHVYTAAQTRDMMRGGDNAELIAELRELRARLDKIERNTAVLPQTHDVIDRVTAGGNAMLTEAA